MYAIRSSSALRLFHFFCFVIILFSFTTTVQLIRSYGDEILSANSTSCDNTSLYHISITNETHRTWFLIMAEVHHPPAVILVHTKGDSELSVNCSGFHTSNALEYRNTVNITNVIQSYGWILHRIMRYNDTDNTGIIPEAASTSTKTFLGSNLDWKLTKLDDSNKEPVTIEFQAQHSLDSHEKINGAIKLIFQVYQNPMKPIKTLYYEIENSFTLLAELILDQVDVVNEVQRFAPVLLIFSNHSLEDNQDYLEQNAVQVNAEEGPLGRNIQSTFIELGTRKSKTDSHQEWISPNAYLHFPAAFWTNREENKAQAVKLGPRRIFNHKVIKTRTYHLSLPFAFYGSRFEQIHAEANVMHVAAREQIINLGSPKSSYYIETNYSSWKFLLGLGLPNIIVTEPPSGTGTTSSIVGAFLGGIGIICGIITGVYIVRRALIRYHRIPASNEIDEVAENNNNNNNNNIGDLNTNGRYIEQCQYEKLVQPLPDH
uniref:Uncharacterized protein n=1 Tax=Trichobilharzia regenti TaxID=157069 RepID=A0AA85IXT5_TRIRE|nr:unnamed protein product [Trichobilharzia regenti]